LAYNISYKKSVQKDLAALDTREARRILDRLEKELRHHPETYPTLKGDYAGLRKLRVGDYRVIYTILGDEVLVLRIGNRKDVYK
jgi:mRNA interferase RelE/StbE